jgi:hypothetical protein
MTLSFEKEGSIENKLHIIYLGLDCPSLGGNYMKILLSSMYAKLVQFL